MSIREIFDADRHEADLEPTEFPTADHKFEVNCEMCGEVFYVDEVTFDEVTEAIQKGLENPFVCPECQAEYDELNFG